MMLNRNNSLIFVGATLVALVCSPVFAQHNEMPDDIDIGVPEVYIDGNYTDGNFTDANYTDIVDDLPETSSYDANVTFIDLEIDCTCDDRDVISCINEADEIACQCEDGDVMCKDDPIMDEPDRLPLEQNSAAKDPSAAAPSPSEEPLELDTTSVISASHTVDMFTPLVLCTFGFAMFWN